jgi:hypothetical protein
MVQALQGVGFQVFQGQSKQLFLLCESHVAFLCTVLSHARSSPSRSIYDATLSFADLMPFADCRHRPPVEWEVGA